MKNTSEKIKVRSRKSRYSEPTFHEVYRSAIHEAVDASIDAGRVISFHASTLPVALAATRVEDERRARTAKRAEVDRVEFILLEDDANREKLKTKWMVRLNEMARRLDREREEKLREDFYKAASEALRAADERMDARKKTCPEGFYTLLDRNTVLREGDMFLQDDGKVWPVEISRGLTVEEAQRRNASLREFYRDLSDIRELPGPREDNDGCRGPHYTAPETPWTVSVPTLDGPRVRVPLPKGWFILPEGKKIESGDRYYSTLEKGWMSCSDAVGGVVCSGGVIIRRSIFSPV